ncbi:BTB/POZ domain-containing protein 6-A-like [Physella acuta]|uniref:BTB/POZ domain-containing protein 6-A-like n=1 Tax=Physella acuta TaxID=109671 RepID=UPI0027DDEFDE|nr:BTB/POZ domain-containing protein 6-A-like [Physella acuta]
MKEMELLPHWQNCDDIIKSNQTMLDHQYACDIHFKLGKDGLRQGAHRYILISRSPVFDAMLQSPLQENGQDGCDVTIPDIEPQTFLLFLRYLYCGDVSLSADSVIPLLYCAKKYSTSGLSKKCLSFVEDNLDPQNACALLEQAHFFDEREFHEKVLAVILRRAQEVLASDDVSQLCESCLAAIVAHDNLMAGEELVLNACIRWAKAECRRRGLAETDENCRIMLGSTLYKIRFPLLTPSVFVNEISQGHLLSEEEKVDVMGPFIVSTRTSVFFPSTSRSIQRHQRFNRFQERSQAAFNNRSGNSAITFQINKVIFIEGFSIYGACKGTQQELQIKGQIFDPSDNVVCSVESCLITTGKQDIYDVMFDQRVRLFPDVAYTLVASIQGPHTFAGQHGRLSAFCNGTVFAFSHSEKSQTGTTVTHGQLPGLIYSLL